MTDEERVKYELELDRLRYQRGLATKQAEKQSELKPPKMGWGIFLIALLLSLLADAIELFTLGTIGWLVGLFIDLILSLMLGFTAAGRKQFKKWVWGPLIEKIPSLNILPFLRAAFLIWSFVSSRSQLVSKVGATIGTVGKIPSWAYGGMGMPTGTNITPVAESKSGLMEKGYLAGGQQQTVQEGIRTVRTEGLRRFVGKDTYTERGYQSQRDIGGYGRISIGQPRPIEKSEKGGEHKYVFPEKPSFKSPTVKDMDGAHINGIIKKSIQSIKTYDGGQELDIPKKEGVKSETENFVENEVTTPTLVGIEGTKSEIAKNELASELDVSELERVDNFLKFSEQINSLIEEKVRNVRDAEEAVRTAEGGQSVKTGQRGRENVEDILLSEFLKGGGSKLHTGTVSSPERRAMLANIESRYVWRGLTGKEIFYENGNLKESFMGGKFNPYTKEGHTYFSDDPFGARTFSLSEFDRYGDNFVVRMRRKNVADLNPGSTGEWFTTKSITSEGMEIFRTFTEEVYTLDQGTQRVVRVNPVKVDLSGMPEVAKQPLLEELKRMATSENGRDKKDLVEMLEYKDNLKNLPPEETQSLLTEAIVRTGDEMLMDRIIQMTNKIPS